MNALTFDALDTKEECEKQCINANSTTEPCKYYKFRLSSPPHSIMSSECLLMSADQCTGPGSFCDHNCWSGGLECDDLPNPPTPPPTPAGAKECKVNLASYTPGELHWYCLDYTTIPPTAITVYGRENVSVPHGSTCQTTHK